MITKIAWRNIWRSPVRSFVVIGAVAIGAWAIITLMSFSYGIVSSYVNNGIRNQTSHIQLHHPDFSEDNDIKFSIAEAEQKVAQIAKSANVEAVAARTTINGMLSSSKGARGVTVNGVNPTAEAQLTNLNEKVTQGDFFKEGKRNQILISEKLAEKLKLKLRKKVVVQFQDKNNEIVAGAFRIVGLYSTGNTKVDEANIYVQQSDLNTLLKDEALAHEIAIFLKDKTSIDADIAALKSDYPNLLVEGYQEISPDIKLYETQMEISSTIFITIFMLALIFGIINTMLMAVLERTKELGMLMAVGMNKIKVFGMIVFETILLGMIGAPLGLLLGWLTVKYMSSGVDLSNYAEGMESFGLSTMVYPEANLGLYIQLVIAVFITAVLASIYPARKAIKLKPVEAMRKI